MLTFKFNTEKPYYDEDGTPSKRVWRQDEIRVSNADVAVAGWHTARLIGKLAFALIFKSNPYNLPR